MGTLIYISFALFSISAAFFLFTERLVYAVVSFALFWMVPFGIIKISDYIFNRRRNITNKRLHDSRPPNRDLPEFIWWLKNIEPKYRNLKFYGPDWTIRRKYIAEIYDYKCAICHKPVMHDSGHVHHIDELGSKTGTNLLNNLVFLCRNCHENQHSHLVYRRQFRQKEIKKRKITEEQYFAEKKLDYEFTEALESLIKKTDKFI